MPRLGAGYSSQTTPMSTTARRSTGTPRRAAANVPSLADVVATRSAQRDRSSASPRPPNAWQTTRNAQAQGGIREAESPTKVPKVSSY